LGALRITGQPPALAQPGEVLPPREQLVDVALMPGVEDDCVTRRIESPVQSQGQFDNTEVGSKMPSGAGDVLDKEATDLLCELGELLATQSVEVTRPADRLEQGHGIHPTRALSMTKITRRL